MSIRQQQSKPLFLIGCWVIATGLMFFAPANRAQDDGHEHSAAEHEQHQQDPEHQHDAHHTTERDVEGRRLYDMQHEISPEIADQLRAKIPGYKGYSNADIAMSMQMMGPNYEWYISEASVRAERGLLVLVHGFREYGDRKLKEELEPMAEVYPTAFAFGMSMMMSQHIQLAVDDLVAAGAKEIIVIPAVSAPHNTLMRQWEYIFGLRDEADYVTVPQVQTDAEIIMLEPLGDDPLVAEILLDYADELSTDPENEVVLIVAHGPSFEDDNVKQLEMMENLTRVLREDGGFALVTPLTLQDDAPVEIRDANVARIRAAVEEAKAGGQGCPRRYESGGHPDDTVTIAP